MLTLVLTACTPPDVALPTPTGPFSVGYSALPQFYMTALYPAVEGTGRGTPTYFTPATLASTGLSDATLGDVIVSAEINAVPVATGPRPVAIIGPGGSSYVELSTSLAQELASHGYVVLLVQPDASAEGGFNLGTETPTEEEAQVLMDAQAAARIAQLVAALDLIDDPLATALVGEMDPTRVAVGGHSYGGHAAFATASQDARVSALFDLDGALYDETAEVAPLVPSLAVLADMYQLSLDPDAFDGGPGTEEGLATLEMFAGSENLVAVGLVDGAHYAVTDLPVILPVFPAAIQNDYEAGVGAIGESGTTNTNTLVLRFLDAVFAATMPTGPELADGLGSVDADPL